MASREPETKPKNVKVKWDYLNKQTEFNKQTNKIQKVYVILLEQVRNTTRHLAN
jgi:hypothetical protein